MKIGSGWTKTTDNGDTFISCAVDETILEMYPQLKNLSFALWHVKKEERKNENSPHWTISIKPKKEKTEETSAVDVWD